ncbi:unnamed protein product [Somion occarium]|uniref:Ribosomal eL28/Mak16 domain-containing protein n=1 Tax=Somion occarium TaxID=3059160 RepID=A0ABP1CGN3_9APHY
MSSDLQWLLLRNNNAFIVKRVEEGPIFSKEPGNLTNLHSFKYSGLANSKTIDVQQTPSGIQIATAKKGASPHALAKRGYRPDLRQAAIARVSALAATQKEKKPSPPKKLRGKKALAIAAALD